MLIPRRDTGFVHPHGSEITPRAVYESRRTLLRQLAGGAAGATLAAWAARDALAAAMRQNKALQLARTPLAELWRHPIHTREIGSHLTNVLRCLYLEACGYQVTVTELVGWEHSMKNELIIARHTGQKKRSAVQRLRELLEQFGLQEALAHRYPALPPSE